MVVPNIHQNLRIALDGIVQHTERTGLEVRRFAGGGSVRHRCLPLCGGEANCGGNKCSACMIFIFGFAFMMRYRYVSVLGAKIRNLADLTAGILDRHHFILLPSKYTTVVVC